MRDTINYETYNALKKVMIHWGFGDIEASIYALLVLKNKPMGAREIAEKVGYAYSSVVNALNQLRRYELVERDKNGKCYSYHAVIDFIKILKNERRRVKKLLTEIKEALKNEKENYTELLQHLENGIKYLGKIDKEVK